METPSRSSVLDINNNSSVVELAESLKTIVNEDRITEIRKIGDKILSSGNDTQWNMLRDRCKTDLYFLSKGVLGYNQLTPTLHGSVCSWFERNRTARFKELLLPRGHYKSTILTESHPVQIVLPFRDEIKELVSYPENLAMNTRVLIAHEISGTASKFLIQITAHFMNNPLLMALFPECVPNRRDHRINLQELELPRSENWKEPTFQALGTGGKAQGYHFNYIKLDDLIGEEARESKITMQRAKDWFDNIRSFFISFGEDHLDLIGTRWAFDDLYNHAHIRMGKKLLKYIRGAEEIAKDSSGKPLLNKDGKKYLAPIFPEKFTLEDLADLKQNKKIYAAQYANDPTAGGALFEPRWKRYYTWVNESVLKINKINYHKSELDICILIDPAMSGKAGFIVTGMNSLGDIAILEALKKEWRPNDLVDLLFKMVDKWNPRVVVIEKVLFSALFGPWLNAEMRLRQKIFRIELITTGNIEKEARVLGLSNYYAASQIFYHISQDDLILEHDQFGATDDYHMLDALAQGPKVWRRGYSKERLRESADAFNLVNGGFNKPDEMTGY